MDAGLEFSDHVEPESAAILGAVRAPNELVHPQGNPHVRAQAGLASLEIRRRDSDYTVQAPVDLNRLADDGPVGTETRTPHGLTDYCYRPSSAPLFFRRKETTAESRVHTEHVEVIRRGQSSINPLRLVGAGKGDEIVVVRQEAGEALSMVTDIQVIKIRERRSGVLTRFSPHHRDQVAGVGHSGDGVEQGGVDPTEDGAVGANAQRQGQYRDRRKAGALRQHAQAELQVLNQGA